MESKGRSTAYLTFRLVLLVGLATMIPAAASAAESVKPGDFISAENASRIKDLVSPGVYFRVTHGMSMKISQTSRIDWPPPYKDATEKYSGQVRLGEDKHTLVGYVAGQPFPLIDPNDPDIGVKLALNNVFRPISTDDYDLRFFGCQSVYVGTNKPFNPWYRLEVGHYSGYALVGRTEVDPMPVDPDFRISNRLWLFAAYPVLAPQEARGAGIIRYRYADARKADDSWAWTPGSRRLRRLNEAILSTSTLGNINPDHYSGFNPKTENFDYKFLGEKMMLACVNAEHSPEPSCPTDGGGSTCPEKWEMRHMFVVAAMPRRDRSPGTLQSKTVIYEDGEVWFNPYVDTYDRRGELWQNNVYWLTYRDRPVPDAKVAIYPFKREFVVAASGVNIQTAESDVCFLPSQDTPERECWYINMGAVDRQFFTTQAMVKAAP
jgi:hypothetical protein